MKAIQLITLAVALGFLLGIVIAPPARAVTLADVRQQIEQDAKLLRAKRSQRDYFDAMRASALRVSEACRDFPTADLIGPGGLIVPPPQHASQEVRDEMRAVAASALVNIADARADSRLGEYLKRWGPASETCILVAAVGSFADDQARDWLFNAAMNSDSSPYGFSMFTVPGESFFALQLLRRYEPTESMRLRVAQEIEKAAQASTPPQYSYLRISREQALRSAVSSWDYGDSLDTAAKKRYQAFQAKLWRYYTCTRIGDKSISPEFDIPAAELLKQWQPGEEQFILHIFEGENITPCEIEIALRLTHKIPDQAKLIKAAENNLALAPHVKECLKAATPENETREGD